MPVQKIPHQHNSNINHILTEMPAPPYFDEASAVFQQFSDSSRLRVFWLLCHTEECVSNIAAAVGMSNAAVSHHLKSLRLHNLISNRREGKEIYYRLADTELAALAHQIVDDFFRLSCPAKGLTGHDLKHR